jgi:8-amino-7-oxononanoate synthase
MFEKELENLQKKHLLRQLTVTGPSDGASVMINGRRSLLMCSNDYLGLSQHPGLRTVAKNALDEYGCGTGSSRLMAGSNRLHSVLERTIADFKGTEAAILLNSGYSANTGIIPAITGQDDLILSDSLNHASIIDGCRLSKATTIIYDHADIRSLESLLKNETGFRRTVVITEGVFSMEGDIAPLKEIVSISKAYGAWLMVDDAHGVGVLGKSGKGTAEHHGITNGIDIQMGTLGKAIGSFGAYAAGSEQLIEYLINSARSYMFSTSLPASVCAASIAGLELIGDMNQARSRLQENCRRFIAGLKQAGIVHKNHGTPIIPIIVGDAERTLKSALRLRELGIFVTAIRPPTVPEGTSRLRFTISSSLSTEDIDTALDALSKINCEGYLY